MTKRRAMNLLLLLGAVCWIVAGNISWFTQDFHDELTGPVHVTVSGSAVLGLLFPGLFVVVAGLAAGALSGRIMRRIVGIAIAAVGLGVAVWAVIIMSTPAPMASIVEQLKRPAAALAPVVRSSIGPILSVLGGLLIATAGGSLLGAVATKDRSRGRRSNNYVAPAVRRDRSRQAQLATSASHDENHGDDTMTIDQAETKVHADLDMWQAIDAGIDPTVGSAEAADL